tara:strand:- start:1195 stop:2253 length:1059 start_codon:yes stop_codon:yes gene_type:complete
MSVRKPPKPKFFIGSSSEAWPLVRALVAECNKRKSFPLDPLHWKTAFEEASSSGRSVVDVILGQTVNCDFAILFWTPDDILLKRPSTKDVVSRSVLPTMGFTARDNVILEAGIFLGALGRSRVLIAINEKDFQQGNLLVPSDFFADMQVWDQYYDEKRHIVKAAIGRLADRLEKDWKRKRFILEGGSSRVYTSREDCYLAGIQLVERASTRVASVLGYESEVYEDGQDVWKDGNRLEGKLFNAIKAKMNQEGVRVDRWCNKDVPSIERQMEALLKFVKQKNLTETVRIRDTKCKFIEVLIADNEVLIVLPRGGKRVRKSEVSTGVHIHNPAAANFFFEWFLNHLPNGSDIKP